MTAIQNNITRIEKLKSSILNHCMTVRLEDTGAEFRVIFPNGYRLGGVQASYSSLGKIVALEKILIAIEREWKESFA